MVNAHVTISTDPTVGHTPHYFVELPQEDEERLGNLFNSLDVDGNGKIDIHDLTEALREFGVHLKYAETFLERADVNKSSDISLAEFIHYVREHEKNLRLGFSHIDKNKDGKIDLEELIRAFKELGVDVEINEAKKLLQRMDQDGSLEISFNEWRDFLLYAPSTDIHDLIRYWRHSMYLDIGEDMNVPDDFTPSEMISGMWWRHLVAGGVAGAVSRTCTAPLDRLKVFMQVHGCRGLRIVTCLRGMLKEGGILSLWRGNGINVLKIAPESAIKFWAYEQAKRIIRRATNHSTNAAVPELTIYERFAAGSIAGGVSQSIIYPLEVLKTRFALRKTGEYRNIIEAVKKIYKTEGIRCFYRGYVPNLLGILPYAGIDLAVYETLKNNYLRRHEEEAPSAYLLLACGTASSTCGQVCSYPLALVRTRLQAQFVDAKTKSKDTMTSVFKDIIKAEGLKGLYRGITPNFMKVAPAVSISYLVYEKTRVALGVEMS